MEKAPPAPASDFHSIHKRAAEIVENDTMLAYAIGNELRRRLVGYSKDSARHELFSRMAFGAWNAFAALDQDRHNPHYVRDVIALLSDTIIIGFDILTDRRTNGPTN